MNLNKCQIPANIEPIDTKIIIATSLAKITDAAEIPRHAMVMRTEIAQPNSVETIKAVSVIASAGTISSMIKRQIR